MLFRGDAVEENGDEGEDHVRQPEGDSRRKSSCMNEHLTESEEEDICKGKTDTYTDVPTDSSTSLL